MSYEIKHSSFAVALEPEFNEENEWTGCVTATVEEEVYDDLSEDDAMKIRHMCALLASCMPLMEEDEDFLTYVKAYFTDKYQYLLDELIDDTPETPTFTRSKDGKVIQLNFNTKTHGSA